MCFTMFYSVDRNAVSSFGSMARSSNLGTMARYSMNSAISGTHSPVRWDTMEFNFGITYKNGIITITQPGYYRITAACHMNENKSEHIELETLVNGNRYVITKASWGSPGFRRVFEWIQINSV